MNSRLTENKRNRYWSIPTEWSIGIVEATVGKATKNAGLFGDISLLGTSKSCNASSATAPLSKNHFI